MALGVNETSGNFSVFCLACNEPFNQWREEQSEQTSGETVES